MARSRRFSKAPFVWLVAVAILIELALIPVFLLTGADAVLGDALDAAGIAFNTDLVTATRIMFIEPNTIGPVLLSVLQVASPDIALLIVAGAGWGC